jgi:hypothetical protein
LSVRIALKLGMKPINYKPLAATDTALGDEETNT